MTVQTLEPEQTISEFRISSGHSQVLSAQDLTRFINSAQKGEQLQVLQDFQAWLAGQKSKTTPQTEE